MSLPDIYFIINYCLNNNNLPLSFHYGTFPCNMSLRAVSQLAITQTCLALAWGLPYMPSDHAQPSIEATIGPTPLTSMTPSGSIPSGPLSLDL